MISLTIAFALLLMGALIAMVGSVWLDLRQDDRLIASGFLFLAILILIGVDPITRRFRNGNRD